jgi:hypothetical protein
MSNASQEKLFLLPVWKAVSEVCADYSVEFCHARTIVLILQLNLWVVTHEDNLLKPPPIAL